MGLMSSDKVTSLSLSRTHSHTYSPVQFVAVQIHGFESLQYSDFALSHFSHTHTLSSVHIVTAIVHGFNKLSLYINIYTHMYIHIYI